MSCYVAWWDKKNPGRRRARRQQSVGGYVRLGERWPDPPRALSVEGQPILSGHFLPAIPRTCPKCFVASGLRVAGRCVACLYCGGDWYLVMAS